MVKMWMAGMVAVMLTACSGASSSSSSSTGGTGSGCNGPQDCPDGFACKARACVTGCTSNAPVTGGCVVGATCDNGHCTRNTACSDTTDCAFDKGEVCNFVTGTCGAATETCTEGENETLCNNGYLCHVKVCYNNCQGTKGCPAAKTCNANHTCQ